MTAVPVQHSNEFAYIADINRNTDINVSTALMRDMKIMLHKQEIQKRALTAIWVLGMKEENKEMLTSSGAGQAVVDVMRTYPDNPPLQKLACGAIKQLGGNLHALYRVGAGKEVMNCMELFLSDQPLIEQALSAIKNLGKCKSNAEKMVQAGITSLIVNAMRTHNNHPETLKTACGALWCLATAPECKERMWSEGAGKVVVEVLQQYPDLGRLQENGCGALWTLGYHYSMMRLGAPDVVLDAMRNHSNSQSIVIYGSFLIKSLGQVKSNAIELVEIGAAEILMECLRDNARNSSVEENGCLALWALSLWAENKKNLVERGVAAFVMDVIESSADKKRVFCGAVSVLSNLSAIETKAGMLDRQEGGRRVMEGLAVHKTDETTVEKSLFCLRNLYFWDAPGLRDLGVERTVTDAMNKFKSNETIQKKGQELINKLRD